MDVVRARWSSASFLVYAGGITALLAAVLWLAVISINHGQGAVAGWSVLFWAVAEVIALKLKWRGREVAGGVFAVVGLGLWAFMIGAFFSWFGWLGHGDFPLHGFHWGRLGLELLILLAALVDIRIFRFPLLVLPAAGIAWFFVTDLVSSGGNWSAVVTLLFGSALFVKALSLDSGESRSYGFWAHVVAGLTVGGALLFFWHGGDFRWTLIIITALVFIAVGSSLRRSSYAVLGALGLALATGHFAVNSTFGIGDAVEQPTTWAGPVAFLCLGVFLALLGMWLWRGDEDAEPL